MRKKVFVIWSALIFISISLTPIIESKIQGEIKEEISVEIHTMKGITTITKKLSVDATRRISSLVNKTLTDKEIDALLIELNKYGLLGSFSTQEVKDIINGKSLKNLRMLERTRILTKIFDMANTDNFLLNAFCYFEAEAVIEIFPCNFIPLLLAYLTMRFINWFNIDIEILYYLFNCFILVYVFMGFIAVWHDSKKST